jgi:hypothetical protein
LKIDYESSATETTHVADEEAEEIRQDTNRFRGTKGLMSNIQSYIQEASRPQKLVGDDYEDMDEK